MNNPFTNQVDCAGAAHEVRFSHSAAGIANVAARWSLSGMNVADHVGITVGLISLLAENGNALKAGVDRLVIKGVSKLSLSLSYVSPERKCFAKKPGNVAQLLTDKDYIYFEIDVETKTSRVVFWINDLGLDMGVLPGFENGAISAVWGAKASPGAHMIGGQFADCAYATAAGWQSSDFNNCTIAHNNLESHHYVEVLSSHAIALGDKRVMS